MKGMLKEAVESVWASERQPDEVVLVDDGSYGEETLSNIRQIEQDALAKGLPLQVIRQRNQGLAAARNAGLQAARGEFISFLDGDDRIAPSFYRIALHLLERYPRLGGVAAWACIFGDGIPDGFWNAPQTEFPFLFMENSVVVPCLTRTELLRHLGGYDTRQRYNYEDWELSIRMLAARWPIITIPMHLTHYRVRQDSLYRSMTDVQNQVMRELLLTTHRESVAKFAVEIAMQLENQWKKLSYNAPNSFHWMPASNNVKSFCKMLLYMIKRFLKQTLTDYK
jgi:glycosyltransferase involved in cell wall biosynthesis